MQPATGHAALRRGRVSEPNRIYHVTTATRMRTPIFRRFEIARAAAPCFENRRLLGDATMLAWVLMPDHAHWLLQLAHRDTLDTVVMRLKCASARNVNRVRGTRGTLWQSGFHDHAMRRDEDVRCTARYIVANPLRAGLVKRIGDYPFWNAIWLDDSSPP